MLDIIGSIVVAAVIVLNVHALLEAMPIARSSRLALAAGAGAWVGLAAAAAGAEVLSAADGRGLPALGFLVAFPLVAASAAAILIPAVRSALLAVPMPLLIGLNVSRVFGAFFLLLAAADRLGGPFPLSAGWGDVITGVLAGPLAVLALRNGANRATIAAWNAFGTLDLVAALVLGIASANGSPLQVIHAGAGSAAVQVLPWALIPTALVPFYLVLHAVLFAQLRAGRRIGGTAGQGAVQLA